jgi:hypothetical protein
VAQSTIQPLVTSRHLEAFDRLIAKGVIRPDTYLMRAKIHIASYIVGRQVGKASQDSEEVAQARQFFSDGAALFEKFAELCIARQMAIPRLTLAEGMAYQQRFESLLAQAKQLGLYVSE